MNPQEQPEYRQPSLHHPSANPQRPAGYDDLRATLAWGDASGRTVLTARGPDAVKFIDSFTTAALSSLAAGTGTEAFFADARGWVLGLATILRTEDGLWIDVPAGLATNLWEHLDRYHIRERFELTDESGATGHLILAGPQADAFLATRCSVQPPTERLHHVHGFLGGAPVALVRVDWYGSPGFLIQTDVSHHPQLVAWIEHEGVPRASADAWETARIEAGMPAPIDIPEKTLPQELDRDARAISFTKGCYLGQETVARIDALGHVNRRLVAVAIDGSHPAAGAVVRAGDEVVGRLTSICRSPALGGSLGLGLLQSKAIDAGRSLTVDGDAARVVPVPVLLPVTAPQSQSDEQPSGGATLDDGELLLDTKRFRVVRVTEACTDGSRRQREVVRHPGSVVIVPLLSPHQVCLVEVVRVAVGRTLLELPAGTLDRVESLEEAARRELAEETGYRAGRIMPVGSMWMSPGILRERMHLFVAEELTAGPQALEPGEQIRTRVVAWGEAVAMCLDGRIDDAKTIAGLLLTDARRRQAGGAD